MGIGIGAFIASGVGLLICLGGLLGLWLRRRRFGRRPLVEAVCPQCRYRAADPGRPCSECGADLPTRGVIDAGWPTRRDWMLRAIFVVLFVAPLPLVVTTPAQRLVPTLNREVVVSVIGVADDGGIPRESLVLIESRRWFAGGPSVNDVAPTGVAPGVSFAVPPADAALQITSEAPAGNTVMLDRTVLGDGPYPRRERGDLEGAAARSLDLADSLISGGAAAASAAAGRTRTSRSTTSSSSMSAGMRGGGRVELAQWGYGPLPPETVVPMARRMWRNNRMITPRPETFVLAATILGGALLLRGWWLARRFRPGPAEGATPSP